MKKRIELLAPAGSREAFIGAINAGANAVYISGKNYGARKYANNFSKEEIVDLIKYAHLRNVLVYVTINTIIFESEIQELFDYSDYLVMNKVDAIIVQDLGLVEQFVLRYPDTEIHASTQMNTYNIEQLKYLKDLGVARVILARETSIDTISKMNQEVDIDLEAFIHGALCVSYSGNCLFSSMNGGRSGNRGECAQPCRLPYKLYKEEELIEEESYLLSTKDLMTIENLSMVIESGLKSLKIEGRMKKPEYVIATVRAYREAIDAYFNNEAFSSVQERIHELESVFNRDYTKGYILKEEPFKINNSFRPNHQGVKVGKVISFERGKTEIQLFDKLSLHDGIRILGETDLGGQVDKIVKNGETVLVAYKDDIITIDLPKSVEVDSIVMKTLDRSLEDSLNPYLQENFKLIKLTGKLECFVGNAVQLTLKSTNSKEIVIESDYIIELAKKASQSKEKILSSFDKFGSTFYELSEFEVQTDGIGFIPNIIFNNLRRDALELIETEIFNSPDKKIVKFKLFDLKEKEFDKQVIVVKVETEEQLRAAKSLGIEDLYIAENLKVSVEESGAKFMNRIWSNSNKYKLDLKLVIRDIGGIQFAKDKEIISDSTFNVTNSLSLASLVNKNVSAITLSLESSVDNSFKLIKNFFNNYQFLPNIELIVYGKADLMLTKYCPITKSEGVYKENCSLCQQSDYSLYDTNDNQHKLVRDGFCNLRILHYRPLNLIKYLDRAFNMGVNRIRLDFTDESYEETVKIIQCFRNAFKEQSYRMPEKNYTTGRFLR
ncbi:MAG: U32 family peptidase [Tenericutes bacterium]|nr:U32 family peptidase [Mycoplasmatota bacterium]